MQNTEDSKMVKLHNGTVQRVAKEQAFTDAKARFYRRKRINRFAGWLYRKLQPYPKLLRFCSRINGKLKIVKNPEQMLRESIRPQQVKAADCRERDSIRKPSELNVAAVVDEFTYNSFRFECHMFPVEPDNWQKVFSENRIDIFFCESAWVGTDNERHPWKGQVYGSCNFSKENRTDLFQIIEYCKANHIPTVLWNKEDPAHYEDKVHNFVDTALRFDHIFTTDAGCVEELFGDNDLFADGKKPISLWRQMLTCIGYPYQEENREVCLIYQIRDAQMGKAAAAHFDSVRLMEKRAIFLVSRDADAEELQFIMEQYEGFCIRVVAEHYCREYEDVLQINSAYFIFADESLSADFVEKALLHTSYLPKKTGIMKGSHPYRFKTYTGYRNILYPSVMFDTIKQYFYKGNQPTQEIYMI